MNTKYMYSKAKSILICYNKRDIMEILELYEWILWNKTCTVLVLENT